MTESLGEPVRPGAAGLLITDPAFPTPAFVIDRDTLEGNLERAKRRCRELGVALRPHLKTHKSVWIARRQMTSPEGPATVSTLAEARAFAAAGVRDLIYAVGIAPGKLPEAVSLVKKELEDWGGPDPRRGMRPQDHPRRTRNGPHGLRILQERGRRNPRPD